MATNTQDLLRLVTAVARLSAIPHAKLHACSKYAPFSDLVAICAELFPSQVGVNRDGTPNKESVRWALLHLLDTTGVPSDSAGAEAIARSIVDVFVAEGGETLHLCPLDKADEIPPIRFGPCEVRRFSKSELAETIQLPRLKRRFPNLNLDVGALARFDWLVVREPVSFGATLNIRSSPFRTLDFRMDQDFGAIRPFAGAWPDIVHRGIFALLLLPWEEMVCYSDVDWRAFRVPWVYSIAADPLASPAYPPAPESLSWEPDIYHDTKTGEEIETERPTRLPLRDELENYFGLLTDVRWAALERLHSSPIFNSLAAHFLVRAFNTDEIDEFLAHVTTIEAALGMASDHGVGIRRPPIGKKHVGATERVARRVAALTGDPASAVDFRRLFDTRSTYIHGRPMADIPSATRVRARVLARRVIECLVHEAQTSTAANRSDFLSNLCL